MRTILQSRLGTNTRFTGGEEVMLALSLAVSDLGAVPGRILGGHELTHTQYNLLRMLRGAGKSGLAHKEIAARLIVGAPDITRLMDALVQRDLVLRRRSPADRRRVIHRITQEGTELLAAIDPPMQEFHEWLAEAMTPESRAALVGACERLIELAATNTTEPGDRT